MSKLTEAQEGALYDYIARLDELGVCVRLSMIVSCANYLLQRGHDGPGPPPSADSRWAKNWLKRPDKPPLPTLQPSRPQSPVAIALSDTDF
ncbi:hypothetical protein DM02DRAFT_576171 [Periconia macrospinosa]|uniref:HTH CENPB-type domain-containing protein n=1 Tax=Periconia macrospinosa TaxID=97972 RepID=A0A2V1D257_9PLEO|nr:hypothetical protein DM02DRAFT_576171 [Periconia macrospinosa]